MKKIQKMLAGLLLIGGLSFGLSLTVHAEEIGTYGFVQDEKGVMWFNPDGTKLKDSWFEHEGRRYHVDQEGYIQVGLSVVDGKTYYLYPEGKMATGWLPLDGALYFFYNDGTMATNTTIGTYQIGKDGKATSNNALAQTVNTVIAGVTTADMAADQKLAACYQYIIDHTSYKRSYETPSGDWTGGYALEVLTSGQGNCYRYAAGLAYLAKGLGYDVKVVTGTIKAARGGVTPHGWVEINIGGQWYIFDAEMQDAKGYDLFCKTYKNYPVKPLNKEKEWEVHF